jgi:hypothetical protein
MAKQLTIINLEDNAGGPYKTRDDVSMLSNFEFSVKSPLMKSLFALKVLDENRPLLCDLKFFLHCIVAIVHQ